MEGGDGILGKTCKRRETASFLKSGLFAQLLSNHQDVNGATLLVELLDSGIDESVLLEVESFGFEYVNNVNDGFPVVELST